MTAGDRRRKKSFGNGRTVARGPRIVLRYPRWTDEDALLALRRESWSFLSPWEPDHVGYDPLGSSWFARYMRFGDEHQRLRLLVCTRRSGRIVGSLSIGDIERERAMASVGYWIGANFARKGYMREALSLALEFARVELELTRIEAYVLPENDPSKRLLESVGFTRAGIAESHQRLRGVLRDHERWIICPSRAGSGSPD